MADVRLTANISPEVSRLLDVLAETLKTTKTQALNQAIATAAKLYQAQAEGGKVVVRIGNTRQEFNLPTEEK
jgi:predicted transcriptional regulator